MENRAYEDVKYRVTTLMPLYLEQDKDKKYQEYLRVFWVEVLTADSLFEASQKVEKRFKQLLNGKHRGAWDLRRAYGHMIEILKSTKKYYGVGLEVLFKHDLVLQ